MIIMRENYYENQLITIYKIISGDYHGPAYFVKTQMFETVLHDNRLEIPATLCLTHSIIKLCEPSFQ